MRLALKGFGATPSLPKIYENVSCHSDPPSDLSGGGEAGNSDSCDDYDFTEYDIYGMLMLWWTMKERGEYCGPARTAGFVGDEQAIGPDGKPAVTPDGGQILNGSSGQYIVGGPVFCRRNPKDWLKEQFYELLFLGAMKGLCDSGKTTDALHLMSSFIQRKSKMRDQWVTRVPGFISANVQNTNGRYRYLIGRIFLEYPAVNPIYFYVPRTAPFLDQYKTSTGWRWSVPGEYDRPGNVVEPPADGLCEVRTALGTTVLTVKFFADAIMSAGTLFGLADWKNYANLAFSAVQQAALHQKVTVTADFSGLGKELGAAQSYYTAGINSCVPESEYKLKQFFTDEWFKKTFTDAVTTGIPPELLQKVVELRGGTAATQTTAAPAPRASSWPAPVSIRRTTQSRGLKKLAAIGIGAASLLVIHRLLSRQ